MVEVKKEDIYKVNVALFIFNKIRTTKYRVGDKNIMRVTHLMIKESPRSLLDQSKSKSQAND